MATLVFFHAHPDDEAIATGGTMALAAAAGHRVVLVCATDGGRGEVAPGFLRKDETLASRRSDELAEAADHLGVARLEMLGYGDSGMDGEESNHDPGSFWRADVAGASQRLAQILIDERADVVTCYDANGGYGHPDHIQVHRVGHRATKIAGTPRVYEATINRDHIAQARASVALAEHLDPEIDLPDAADSPDFGVPDSAITTAVDVTAALDAKRAAMAAHASQITSDSVFLALPDDLFAHLFGREWYIRTDRPVTGRETSLLEPDGPRS